MTGGDMGLRERKKAATRVALREAALRLALERGPEHVRVHDIADAVGVSPRTYNNYFSSREQAIVAAITAEREQRIAAALVACPAGTGLAEAVIGTVVDHLADPGPQAHGALSMIIASPALRQSYADSVATSEQPLTEAILQRVPGLDPMTARVLASSVGAAARIAIASWLAPAEGPASPAGFVVPTGSLSDRLRAALAPLAPAFDAAGRPGGYRGARDAASATDTTTPRAE